MNNTINETKIMYIVTHWWKTNLADGIQLTGWAGDFQFQIPGFFSG